MSEDRKNSNEVNGIALLQNLSVAAVVLDNMTSRVKGLPGIAVLYGPAGYGKTYACTAVANQQNGYYVQMRSLWNRKTFLEKILFEMGITAESTNAKMLDQICTQLALSGRPLIIDEADYCLRTSNQIELVRDIHEASQGTILLVGEEDMPTKIKKYERFHSRVLAWVPALPVSVKDAELLCKIYCPGIKVAPVLLEHIVKIAKGSVRRVVVNLTVVKDTAALKVLDSVDLEAVGEENLYTGDAPVRGRS